MTAEINYDATRGIVFCRNGIFLTVGDVRRVYADTQIAIQQCRRDYGDAKLLVLALEAQVQSAEVMAEVDRSRWRMIHPDDRMALVVSSSLVKMQAARTFVTDQEKAFLSESAAMTWLMASREGHVAQAS